ncbi:hypothetical protein EJ04DRAFT_104592 [Polyplosphaeria fusca]|uniref:Uncharacterized protein n=1 Tax=Polyplosphaeria fusca TaxID=682080 RepID=A0A9P4QKT2_9PLEO|nr:hypothetical protein EJ04DRAFT_104592 [Polyplosphaeria fusca]
MAQYEFNHTCDITESQQLSLAMAVTNLHCKYFATPSMFVNVIFKKTREGDAHFVGGKKVICRSPTPRYPLTSPPPAFSVYRTRNNFPPPRLPRPQQIGGNFLLAHLRPHLGTSRSDHDALISDISCVWTRIVKPPLSSYASHDMQSLDDPFALHTVFLLHDIYTGTKMGMTVPRAVDDLAWAFANMEQIKRRMHSGEDAMRTLLVGMERMLEGG